MKGETPLLTVYTRTYVGWLSCMPGGAPRLSMRWGRLKFDSFDSKWRLASHRGTFLGLLTVRKRIIQADSTTCCRADGLPEWYLMSEKDYTFPDSFNSSV